ncbi:oxidase ustYa family protein [Aspergillus undulatus]|uniref:oxidase ustYa family protein n=1 Tax=Aspergillus undulatus TaxID=1810928 RepID=UPI003CCD2443
MRGLATNDYQKNAILRPVSWWSPILDAVEIPTYTTTLNGTLFALSELSIAREEPDAENDAAWAQYERVLTHVVTREDILKLGKHPETVARFDDDYWGFGDDAYMVQLDVMHQIHCLNILRKAAFATYPGYTPNPNKRAKDRIYWIHLSHCVDILLQNLQCNANTEVLTLSWVEDRASPWPDFSVKRKCRDFGTLVNWQRENAVDPEMFGNMTRPTDAFVWPAPWKGDTELGIKLGEHQLQGGIV